MSRRYRFLEYFFHLCTHVIGFWNSLENWWNEVFEITLKLETTDVIFGFPNPNNDIMINIFNLCILWAKWYISLCKQKEVTASIHPFLSFLKCKLETERVICTCNDTLDNFNIVSNFNKKR